ncbi:MAG: alpha-L-rhamnosidase C-terminal domain-containing protein, partial [Lentisphaerota bacterium]
PSLIPSCGWGFNGGGGGPAWDSALLLIPWHVHLFTGNKTMIETHYDAMKKYVDYCSFMAKENIVSFGLGDWCHHDRNRMVSSALTSTSYYYIDAVLIARFAGLTGHDYDQRAYSKLAADIRRAFNQRFYRGAGIYANGEPTALGCALHHGLVEDATREEVVKKLVNAVEANGYKSDFGILGAKYVPRVLADNGYAEAAYRIITQPDFPGWAHWLSRGATTLWESWEGSSSLNHIMFGDISAWMYQYLGGITPDPNNPGFKHVIIQPRPVPQLAWVKARHKSPYGMISVAWEKNRHEFKLDIEIPTGTSATVILPDTTTTTVDSGVHHYSIAHVVANE